MGTASVRLISQSYLGHEQLNCLILHTRLSRDPKLDGPGLGCSTSLWLRAASRRPGLSITRQVRAADAPRAFRPRCWSAMVVSAFGRHEAQSPPPSRYLAGWITMLVLSLAAHCSAVSAQVPSMTFGKVV